MQKIEEETCIRFDNQTKNPQQDSVLSHNSIFWISIIGILVVPSRYHRYGVKHLLKTHDKDYIEFKNGFMECHSKVGRQGLKQEIVLAPQCAEEHTIVHEVCFLHDFQFE